MRREDKRSLKLAKTLRATADPIGSDYLGWFRVRTDGSYYSATPPTICHLEPIEQPEPPPDWFQEHYQSVMHYTEAQARSERLAPGSLALVSVSVPRGYSYDTDCGTEHDVETGWEVCWVAPHPCFEEAWRRTVTRYEATRSAQRAAKLAQEDAMWRQPWRMAVNLHYHDGTTFNGCGDGPPRHDESLRGYGARLVFDGESLLGGTVNGKAWLAYGPHRKTKDEAVAALAEVLAKAGRKIDLSKLKRLESRVW